MNRLRVAIIMAFILCFMVIEGYKYKLYEIKQKLVEIEELQAKMITLERENEVIKKQIQELLHH